jgi:acyl-CoA synthetase (AMP-forming)/AMP-acid ligase II
MQIPQLPYEPTFPSVLHHAAQAFAERDFIVTADARMTYADVERRSRPIAKALLAAGAGKGSRIGLAMQNGMEWVLAWAAVSRIGAVFVPLSTTYKPAELLTTARHADLDTLIVPARLFGRDCPAFLEDAFPSLAGQRADRLLLEEAPYLRSIRVAGSCRAAWATPIDLSGTLVDSAVSDALLAAVEAQVTPADPVVTVYSSGTTGTPKGVVHTHGSMLRHGYQLGQFMGVGADWRTYCGSPFFWVSGLGAVLSIALHRGSAVITLPRHDDETALKLMEREGATHMIMWGTVRQKLDHYVESSGRDISNIPAFVARRAGRIDFGVPPGHGSLGMTETWGMHSGPSVDMLQPLPPSMRGSFGIPFPCIEHRVVDPASGREVQPGEEGELWIRGYSLMHGYYKREDHETFDDEHWLRTGDRVLFRDGCLFYTGRYSEIIKSAGANVSPPEVEAVLMAAPDVGLAVVVGLADAERGEIVAAALLPRPGMDIDLAAVRARVDANLSSFKQPRRYLVLSDTEFPYLATGKPDKRALAAWLRERGQ